VGGGCWPSYSVPFACRPWWCSLKTYAANFNQLPKLSCRA
jgi:hypothetical protein